MIFIIYLQFLIVDDNKKIDNYQMIANSVHMSFTTTQCYYHFHTHHRQKSI